MTQIKIASFNVNSVKARLPRVLEWMKKSNPDIVLLQELKCVEEAFPFEAFFDAGYNAAVYGQKTYNGVAILSKFKIEDVVKGLPHFDDEQARYIEAVIPIKKSAIRVASIYVPNGGGEITGGAELEHSPKFIYKLKFYDHLKSHLAKVLAHDEIQIFGGDFNVAAEAIDVYDPKSFEGQVLFHPLERQKFRALLNLGLVDSYRVMNPVKFEEMARPQEPSSVSVFNIRAHAQATQERRQNSNFTGFSWWDYRGGAWQHNKGVRIDYLLASPQAADKISAVGIEDKGVRDQEKASDHCPVVVELKI